MLSIIRFDEMVIAASAYMLTSTLNTKYPIRATSMATSRLSMVSATSLTFLIDRNMKARRMMTVSIRRKPMLKASAFSFSDMSLSADSS